MTYAPSLPRLQSGQILSIFETSTLAVQYGHLTASLMFLFTAIVEGSML